MPLSGICICFHPTSLVCLSSISFNSGIIYSITLIRIRIDLTTHVQFHVFLLTLCSVLIFFSYINLAINVAQWSSIIYTTCRKLYPLSLVPWTIGHSETRMSPAEGRSNKTGIRNALSYVHSNPNSSQTLSLYVFWFHVPCSWWMVYPRTRASNLSAKVPSWISFIHMSHI